MRSSFYTAAAGAAGNLLRISVISNNMANVNTAGYKSKNSVFSDLIYTALAAQNENIEKGHGIRMDKTDSLTYQPGALNQTGRDYDFAIEGPGFFGLLDPDTDNTIYTRDGSFEPVNIDGEFYLCDSMGRQVLDADGEPVLLSVNGEDGNEGEGIDVAGSIGIFNIPIQDGLDVLGYNVYAVSDKNGEVYSQANMDNEEPRGKLLQGMLEMSNVELAKELSQLIESQKAYQLSLKMLQTSDEIEQLECELRR